MREKSILTQSLEDFWSGNETSQCGAEGSGEASSVIKWAECGHQSHNLITVVQSPFAICEGAEINPVVNASSAVILIRQSSSVTKNRSSSNNCEQDVGERSDGDG